MGKARTYEGDGIVVTYEVLRCIHAAECVHGLPDVFDAQKRPWIDASKAAADQIAAAVEGCPTGALSYRRTDGGPEESIPVEARIELVQDGPVYVTGSVELALPDETLHWSGTRAALCRCGASQNKPFCDNSHKNIGFTSENSE